MMDGQEHMRTTLLPVVYSARIMASLQRIEFNQD